MTDNDIISDILEREGGFVNDPADAGGPTCYGITQRTLSEWRLRPVSVQEIRELPEAEARAIYLDRYIVRPGFNLIESPAIRASVVDMGVNHGVYQATRSFQRVLGVTEDGMIGPVTLGKLDDVSERAVLAKLAAERVRLYGRIISAKPEQAKFASGWLNRAAEFVEALA